jgi:parallel beta-helix repeat protein
MKIHVLFALSSVLAGVLSGAVIGTVYAQSGQVREIGLAPTAKSSDTTAQTSSLVQQPISITEPGNYRLNTNLSGSQMGVISIESSNVTLDLNGFSITSLGRVPPIVAAGSNVAIVNGSINPDDAEAISLSGSNCRVEGLRVSGGADGMFLSGPNCIVKNNTVQAAHTGIICQAGCVVSGNTVSTIADFAIGATNSSLVVGNTATSAGSIALNADDTTGYVQNVLNGFQADVKGGVQIGDNLCVTSKICLP